MKLALGTVQLGLDYGIANKTGKPLKDYSLAILKSAYNNGVCLFDTASGYNDSEKIIGEFIETENPENLLIATKTGSLNQRGVLNCDLHKVIREDIKNSLLNLKKESIDYYMLHNAADLFYYGKDIVNALNSLRIEGIIKKIGISVYNSEDVNELLKYKEITQVQIPFNIFDTRLIKNGMIDRMKCNYIEIHCRSIYLQGLIVMQISEIPDKLKMAGKYIERLDEMADSLGITRKELAYLYVRGCEFVDKMIVGCETQEQLKENVYINKMKELPKEIYKDAMLYFSEISDTILNPYLWKK